MNVAPPPVLDTGRCPACGQSNGCQLAATGLYKGPCWCESVTVCAKAIAHLPENLRGAACLCRSCITRLNAEPRDSEGKPVTSGQGAL